MEQSVHVITTSAFRPRSTFGGRIYENRSDLPYIPTLGSLPGQVSQTNNRGPALRCLIQSNRKGMSFSNNAGHLGARLRLYHPNEDHNEQKIGT